MSSPARSVPVAAILLCLGAGCEGSLHDGELGGGRDPLTPKDDPARPGTDPGEQDPPPYVAPDDPFVEKPACDTPRSFLEERAWGEVVSPVCVGCHIEGGVAASQGSELLLWSDAALAADPRLTLDGFYAHNAEQFRPFLGEGGSEATFVRKALGELDHGGGSQIERDSAGYDALVELARRLDAPPAEECEGDSGRVELEEMLELDGPAETYREAAILFAGRLPTRAETRAIEGASGEAAWDEVDRLLTGLMAEPAFKSWLKYAWNEVFFFRGMTSSDSENANEIVSGGEVSARSWTRLVEDGKQGTRCNDDWEGMKNWERFGYASAAMCGVLPVRYYLSDRLAWSFSEMPLELIAWIVIEGRPFTEILTTSKIAMNYYSSVAYYGSAHPKDNEFLRLYGDEIADESVDIPRDRGRWGGTIVPVMDEFRVMDSMRRTGSTYTTLPTGGRHFKLYYRDPAEYPRAGLLTSQIFLNRYPSTDTNVNRHRAWAYFDLFLGVDILALADRRGDPTAAELMSENPVIDDPNCNVCHTIMDPVAGMFREFSNNGTWQPDESWPPRRQPAMLPPGFSTVGERAGQQHDASMGPALVALAEQTVLDRRFARRMVEHAFKQIIGRTPLSAPGASGEGEAEQAAARGRREAYELERAYLAEQTDAFVASGFDMAALYRRLVRSSYFRARGPAAGIDPHSAGIGAALEGWGRGALSTPEMLHRRIVAALGRPWPLGDLVRDAKVFDRVTDDVRNDFLLRFDLDKKERGLIGTGFRDMYGGIDFFTYTERLREPSSVMASTARRAAHELACVAVAQEFAVPATSRFLFDAVERDDTLAAGADRVRRAATTLHERFLGPERAGAEEIARSIALFDEVQREGAARVAGGQESAALPAHCAAVRLEAGQSGPFTAVETDPDYTVRAWMAVVYALALDYDFLHRL